MTWPDATYLPKEAGRPLPSTHRYGMSHACDTVLVLDCSGSMREQMGSRSRLDAAQTAAIAFVDERSVDPDARIAVVGFHDIALPVCPLMPASSASTLNQAIRSLKADKSTNMLAGLDVAEQCLFCGGERQERREILFLTDGHNTGSSPLPVADRLKQRGCRIYTVGIGDKPESVDEALLRQMASRDAGGRPLYRFIEDQSRLVRHFEEVGRITR